MNDSSQRSLLLEQAGHPQSSRQAFVSEGAREEEARSRGALGAGGGKQQVDLQQQ